MPTENKIGANIASLRRARSLTQAELARQLIIRIRRFRTGNAGYPSRMRKRSCACPLSSAFRQTKY